ncbi:MAG: Panacea domain-containing protein [Alphaproteobacteria bacterium]
MADQTDRPLTNMQLLKLLFFAHGWMLAGKGRPLISNNFEAWEYGPVVRVVYEQFSKYKKNPIAARAKRVDILTGEVSTYEYNFDSETETFLTTILDAYSEFSGPVLSNMTHEPGSPWDQVWNRDDGTINLGLRISDADIKSYFESVARREARN